MAAVVVVDGRRLLSRRAPRSTSPSSRTRRERLRVGGCHRRRVGSAGRGGGASRGAHVPRGSCAEADGRRTGGGSRPPSPCRVCAAPAREAVESGAAHPIRATSVRGTDRTRQCPLCGTGLRPFQRPGRSLKADWLDERPTSMGLLARGEVSITLPGRRRDRVGLPRLQPCQGAPAPVRRELGHAHGRVRDTSLPSPAGAFCIPRRCPVPNLSDLKTAL